jgi:hypothetical protein
MTLLMDEPSGQSMYFLLCRNLESAGNSGSGMLTRVNVKDAAIALRQGATPDLGSNLLPPSQVRKCRTHTSGYFLGCSFTLWHNVKMMPSHSYNIPSLVLLRSCLQSVYPVEDMRLRRVEEHHKSDRTACIREAVLGIERILAMSQRSKRCLSMSRELLAMTLFWGRQEPKYKISGDLVLHM